MGPMVLRQRRAKHRYRQSMWMVWTAMGQSERQQRTMQRMACDKGGAFSHMRDPMSSTPVSFGHYYGHFCRHFEESCWSGSNVPYGVQSMELHSKLGDNFVMRPGEKLHVEAAPVHSDDNRLWRSRTWEILTPRRCYFRFTKEDRTHLPGATDFCYHLDPEDYQTTMEPGDFGHLWPGTKWVATLRARTRSGLQSVR